MTTSIDKIREQVVRVREEHRSDNHPQLPYCSCDPGTKDGSLIPWPCQTLRLAEDKLKLAEALENVRQTAQDWCIDSHGGRHASVGHELICSAIRQEIRAERILAEVAE